jgi:hypothetical protein
MKQQTIIYLFLAVMELLGCLTLTPPAWFVPVAILSLIVAACLAILACMNEMQ